MELLPDNLNPMSLIKRPIDSFTDHYGIYLGNINNASLVFELDKDDSSDLACCRFSTMEEFSNGNDITVLPCKNDDNGKIKERMYELMQLAEKRELYYCVSSSSDWNCEQAARYILTGNKESFMLEAERKTHRKQTIAKGAGIIAACAAVVAGAFTWLAVKDYRREKSEMESKTSEDKTSK